MTVSNRPTSAFLRGTGGAPALRFWSALGVSVAVHGIVVFAVRPSGPDNPGPPAAPASARLLAALGAGRTPVVLKPAQAPQAAAPARPAAIAQPQQPVLAVPLPDREPAPALPPPSSSAPSAPAEAVRENAPVASGVGAASGPVGAAANTAVAQATPAGVAGEAVGGVETTQLAAYRQALIQAALGYKRYPPLARERGWEGTVELVVVLLPRHPAPVLQVSRGSGFALLDEQALEMLSRAARRLPVPEALQASRARFVVPIRFQLGD